VKAGYIVGGDGSALCGLYYRNYRGTGGRLRQRSTIAWKRGGRVLKSLGLSGGDEKIKI